MFSNKLKHIRDVKDMLKDCNNDEYNVGMYNGIELCLAMLEKREPVYKTYVREPEVIEKEEEKGRTISSGIRRRC